MKQADFLAKEKTELLNEENAPIIDIEDELMVFLKKAVMQAGFYMAPERAVDRINLTLRGTGKEISVNTYKKWFAKRSPNTPPMWLLPNLAWALTNKNFVDLLVDAIGYKLSDQLESRILENARIKANFLRAREEAKKADAMMNDLMKVYDDE